MSGPPSPHSGNEMRVEQDGCEVRIVFVCSTSAQAAGLVEDIVKQLRNGTLQLTVKGDPTDVIENPDASRH